MTITTTEKPAATDLPAGTDKAELPTLKDTCIFLAEYTAWLLGSGATCTRMEQNVNRMANALGCRAEMTILTRHIHFTVCRLNNSDSYTYIAGSPKIPVSFNINTLLSRLSWNLADGKIDFARARQEFNDIIATPPTDSRIVLLLASCANAAFCRLFTGDMQAVAIVFIATLSGFYLKQVLTEKRVDTRLIFIICAFVSSVIAATDSLFNIGTTPGITVGTSVLYLVPGIPFLNSFSDMLAGHYICAFSRFVHAAILTFCLSLGLCGGMLLMNLHMF